MRLCEKGDPDIGLTDILVTFTAPYPPETIVIELKWMDGKGWVANPVNN